MFKPDAPILGHEKPRLVLRFNRPTNRNLQVGTSIVGDMTLTLESAHMIKYEDVGAITQAKLQASAYLERAIGRETERHELDRPSGQPVWYGYNIAQTAADPSAVIGMQSLDLGRWGVDYSFFQSGLYRIGFDAVVESESHPNGWTPPVEPLTIGPMFVWFPRPMFVLFPHGLPSGDLESAPRLSCIDATLDPDAEPDDYPRLQMLIELDQLGSVRAGDSVSGSASLWVNLLGPPVSSDRIKTRESFRAVYGRDDSPTLYKVVPGRISFEQADIRAPDPTVAQAGQMHLLKLGTWKFEGLRLNVIGNCRIEMTVHVEYDGTGHVTLEDDALYTEPIRVEPAE